MGQRSVRSKGWGGGFVIPSGGNFGTKDGNDDGEAEMGGVGVGHLHQQAGTGDAASSFICVFLTRDGDECVCSIGLLLFFFLEIEGFRRLEDALRCWE